MTENLSIALKLDKHNLTESLTSHQECNKKSLTDNLPINKKFEQLYMPEKVSSPVKSVKHTITENSMSWPENSVFNIQYMAKNLPSVQELQSLGNNLSTRNFDGLFFAENLPSISVKQSPTINLSGIKIFDVLLMMENFSSLQKLDIQLMAENSFADNLSRNEKCSELSMTENLSCPRKLDIHSVSENAPNFQDKQSLSNDLSRSNECDNISMIKNLLRTPQILDREAMAENLSNPQENQPLADKLSRNKECDELYMTEKLLYPSKSNIESVDENCPRPQDKQSHVDSLSLHQKCDESMTQKLCIQSTTEIADPDSFMSGNACSRETTQGNTDAHYLNGFVRDIYSLYKNGWLSDFKLYSGNKTFPVHKVILSARSPVFKAMFVSTLKEKDDLDIPDIDVDTLERILLFVYSNKVEDLDWNITINLYSAAYRYAIEDLKIITRSSLKSKISASNVLEILVQANCLEDEDLKSLANELWRTMMTSLVPRTGKSLRTSMFIWQCKY